MSISEIDDSAMSESCEAPCATRGVRALHRIAAVRRQQGVSLRQAAYHMKAELRTVRFQENETADLRLSDVYRWQKVLEVPVAELLVETDDPLSAPVMQRARLIRVMKTAASILDKAEGKSLRRLAETLIQQLVEIMPELSGVTPWQPQNPPAGTGGHVASLNFDALAWRD